MLIVMFIFLTLDIEESPYFFTEYSVVNLHKEGIILLYDFEFRSGQSGTEKLHINGHPFESKGVKSGVFDMVCQRYVGFNGEQDVGFNNIGS